MMKLPLKYDDAIHDPASRLAPPLVGSLVYPPLGLFPFHEIGNGDVYGLYWPLECEELPPIVVLTSHDTMSAIPLYGSATGLYACELARQRDTEDADLEFSQQDLDVFFQVVVSTTGRPPQAPDLQHLATDAPAQRLALDPRSPYYLCVSGDRALDAGNLPDAERHYHDALTIFPDYVAAHFGLAMTLRRQRRAAEAAIHLRRALIGSICFDGRSFWSDAALPGAFRNDWTRKALDWLRQLKQPPEPLAEDPFFKRVPELTLDAEMSESNDFDILQEIVEAYCHKGDYAEAVRVGTLTGEFAKMQTVSFRERHGLTASTYGTKLVELLKSAGNDRRATLTENMLGAMKSPQGMDL